MTLNDNFGFFKILLIVKSQKKNNKNPKNSRKDLPWYPDFSPISDFIHT